MSNQSRGGQARPTQTGKAAGAASWIDERLDVSALFRKYGRKAFPVHSSFFLGEMILFSFIILVLTGAYLGFIYIPSNVDVQYEGETLPEAYASVRLIESIPVANLFRNVHHWAAHVMIASIVLHLLRVFFTGTYRKPRELNWAVGVVLLILSIGAGFVGYALPYDSYAVTATGIGYSIARSIPWVGEFASELVFGGAFPTLGSLSRLYTLHVFVLPALLTAVIGVHLLMVIKQKHTQPGYARKMAEPGKVLGVPLLPYQGLLAGQLLLLMFGVLFLLSALVPPHPLEEFGPPQAGAPAVKPDWYLLWVYGFLKIVPAEFSFEIFGATFGPDFLGGLLFPGLLFGLLTLAPWMDRTNRKAVRRFEYMEPVRQSPIRTSIGIAVLVFFGTLFLAAYYDELGMSLAVIWAIVIAVPLAVGFILAAILKAGEPIDRFDPREELEPAPAYQPATSSRVAARPATAIADASHTQSPAPQPAFSDYRTIGQPARNLTLEPLSRIATPAARGERARDNMVTALHQMGELAPLVRQLEDDDQLLEVLDYIESVRATLNDSSDTLRGVASVDRDRRQSLDS